MSPQFGTMTALTPPQWFRERAKFARILRVVAHGIPEKSRLGRGAKCAKFDFQIEKSFAQSAHNSAGPPSAECAKELESIGRIPEGVAAPAIGDYRTKIRVVTMLSVAEALHQVLEHAGTLSPVETALGEALGQVLADAVASDVDSPPHDKSIVDGYAVRGTDLVDGRAALMVQEEITAGNVPKLAVVPGCCARIMTGAPIPEGADSVVMVERDAVCQCKCATG